VQTGLHGTDDSKSDEELVWRDTDWKTIPYREYPWTLSSMQASLDYACSSANLHKLSLLAVLSVIAFIVYNL